MTKTLNVGRSRRHKTKPVEQFFELVTTTHLIRRLPGESRSVLARCNDGLYYIIKFAGNPKGENSLANEVLGYQLADMLDLPTPQFRLAKVSKRSLYESPIDWFSDYPNGLLKGKYHLAIPFLGMPEGLDTTETVPSWNYLLFRRRNKFLGMLLLDIWANNQAARQVVFARGEQGTTPYFVDFGSMFGGGKGIFDDSKFAGMYFDNRFYAPELQSHTIDWWIDIMRAQLPDVLSYGYRQIPPEWYGPSYFEVRQTLRGRLPNLIDIARDLLPS